MTFDPMGLAITDYYNSCYNGCINSKHNGEALIRSGTELSQETDGPNIRVISPDFDSDIIEPSYLFRDIDDMPDLERQALSACRGRVLDIGSGAGSHSLYLQSQGFDVISLDHSKLAVEVQKRRGVKNVLCTDVFHLQLDRLNGPVDTILMMMNGIGIVGHLRALPDFFAKASTWVKPGGQILIDSSDMIYLYIDDDALTPEQYNKQLIGEIEAQKINDQAPECDDYYGEIRYQMEYKDQVGPEFSWLYVDYMNLAQIAKQSGWKAELMKLGDHFDYLARLTKR